MSDQNFFVHPSAVVDENCQIGAQTKIWHFCHVSENAVLGERCNLGQNVYVGPGVRLGNNVKIQNNVSVYEGVECEDDVFLGPSMVFTNIKNPRSAVVRKGEYGKTLVRKGASIGANATVVCGIEIGQYAFIGAGAVVTNDVRPYELVMGNPARHAGWMSEYGHNLQFDAVGIGRCPESGKRYVLQDNRVTKYDD